MVLKIRRKILAILILSILILSTFQILSINEVQANTQLEKVTDDIKYFNASFFDYNKKAFNDLARGESTDSTDKTLCSTYGTDFADFYKGYANSFLYGEDIAVRPRNYRK